MVAQKDLENTSFRDSHLSFSDFRFNPRISWSAVDVSKKVGRDEETMTRWLDEDVHIRKEKARHVVTKSPLNILSMLQLPGKKWYFQVGQCKIHSFFKSLFISHGESSFPQLRNVGFKMYTFVGELSTVVPHFGSCRRSFQESHNVQVMWHFEERVLTFFAIRRLTKRTPLSFVFAFMTSTCVQIYPLCTIFLHQKKVSF